MKKIPSCLRHVFFSFFLVFLFVAFSFAAHADQEKSYSAPAPAGQEESVVPIDNISPAPENAPNNPYRLDAGDHLRIYVFGVPDLTGEFHVSSSGTITMPLIGEIKAEGLNKGELEQEITRRLIAGEYFNDPKVTVEIVALKPFYILGEVKNPGSYPYETDLDVFKAIAIAGGYTPRASKEKIIIIRKMHEEKIRINATEDTPILPGDSIKVEQRFF